MNLLDKQGRPKHCFKCNSVKHFACDCTDLRNNINRTIMYCFKCNSAQHFVCDCTGSRNNINTVMESDQVHFTLFNVDTHYQNVINDSIIKMFKLERETLGMAVLDSACSRTVIGKQWFDIFFDTLNN